MLKKRVILGFLGAIVVFVTFVFLTNNEIVIMRHVYYGFSKDINCYFEPSRNDGIENFHSQHFLSQGEKPEPGRSIFFHETSCFNDDGIVITARQACAVESAALMNPKMTIYMLIMSPSKISNSSKLIVEQLTSYDNVKIRRIVMDDYVKDTPLDEWWASGILRFSRWPRSHMSDILRYLTLWKYGGIYLDLDVVVTTSLDGLGNFAGAEDWDDVAAGVLGIDETPMGRKIADACIRDLKTNFRGDVWGNNGPGVITRILQKICDTTHTKDMTVSRCRGFQVFPPSVFYPIFYKSWKDYFTIDNDKRVMKLLSNARAIHVWNKLSSSENVRVGSKVPYAVIASKHCPKVYGNCGTKF